MNKQSIEFKNKDELNKIETYTERTQLLARRSSDQISDLIQAFISAQDVRQSSKSTYHRTLRQYFVWIDHKGYDLTQVARPQIIEYKTHMFISTFTFFELIKYELFNCFIILNNAKTKCQ